MAANPDDKSGVPAEASVAPARPDYVSTRSAAAVAAFVLPLLFAFYTSQVWEDYYITFRSSRNLAEGHGLVYQLGERVHTFTSPLGVLVPALCSAVTGSDDAALWLFRIVSALGLAGAALLIAGYARDQQWPRPICWFALCLGIFEGKVVAFSVNGMETGFLVFFAALTWHELSRSGGVRWRWLALGYAGLMWTRPDACVLAAAMTFGLWVFTPRGEVRAGKNRCGHVGGAIVVGALIYLPWVWWAWRYYGSPVPQTVIAKSALTPGGLSLGRILLTPFRCLVQSTSLDGLFGPIYLTGGWPPFLMAACGLLARLAAFLWLVPVLPRATRAASLAVLIGGVYLNQIMTYPWYFAPWTLLAALALGGGAAALATRLPTWLQAAGRIVLVIVATGVLALNALQAYAARQQQNLVEEHGRKQIGLWLRAHAKPHDTVFLEPIGYIGYYSGLKILDFPGLVAPEVSRIVRSGPGGYARIIAALKPDWLVLRPYEVADQNLQNSGILDAYDVAGFWNQRPQIDALRFLPARYWLEFDAQFLVYRRHAKPAASGPRD